jgi:hypothetical protein
MIKYLLSFILGFVVKTVDSSVEHGLKLKNYVRYFLSIIYGILLSYLLSIIFLPEFFLGILIGVIFSKKIDSKEHLIAIITFVISSFLFKYSISNGIIILIIAFLCFLEEWINDNVVDKNKVKGFFKKFLSIRPLLEITAIILSIIYSNINIFLLLFLFDLGYLTSKKFIIGKK